MLLFTPFLLELWLGDIPNYTVIFSRIIIVSFLILQLYPGLTRGLYAEGDIKWYQIIISALLVSTIPLGYFLFHIKLPPQTIILVMAIAQFLTLITTVTFAGYKINLNVKKFYLRSVLIPCLLFLLIILTGKGATNMLQIKNLVLQFSIISSIMILVYCLAYYHLVLNQKESLLFKTLALELKKKIKK